MAEEPKRKVLRRLEVNIETVINKDKSVKSAYEDWAVKSEAFNEARAAISKAKASLKGLLGAKLKTSGVDVGEDWEFSEKGSSIVVEILELQRKPRSRIATEKVSF